MPCFADMDITSSMDILSVLIACFVLDDGSSRSTLFSTTIMLGDIPVSDNMTTLSFLWKTFPEEG